MDEAKILDRIKRLVRGNMIRRTFKSDMEMADDGLDIEDIKSVILNAEYIIDVVPSSNPRHLHEALYVVIGYAVNGDLIYTKGKIREGRYYILVSAHLT